MFNFFKFNKKYLIQLNCGEVQSYIKELKNLFIWYLFSIVFFLIYLKIKVYFFEYIKIKFDLLLIFLKKKKLYFFFYNNGCINSIIKKIYLLNEGVKSFKEFNFYLILKILEWDLEGEDEEEGYDGDIEYSLDFSAFFFNFLHKEIFKLIFIFFYYLFLFTNIVIIILYIILYYKNFLIQINFNNDYIKITNWVELRNFKYKLYNNIILMYLNLIWKFKIFNLVKSNIFLDNLIKNILLNFLNLLKNVFLIDEKLFFNNKLKNLNFSLYYYTYLLKQNNILKVILIFFSIIFDLVIFIYL